MQEMNYKNVQINTGSVAFCQKRLQNQVGIPRKVKKGTFTSGFFSWEGVYATIFHL